MLYVAVLRVSKFADPMLSRLRVIFPASQFHHLISTSALTASGADLPPRTVPVFKLVQRSAFLLGFGRPVKYGLRSREIVTKRTLFPDRIILPSQLLRQEPSFCRLISHRLVETKLHAAKYPYCLSRYHMLPSQVTEKKDSRIHVSP